MKQRKNVGRIKYLQDLLNKRQISCRELTERYLKSARACNKKLNAYVKLTDEFAFESAKKVDEKISKKQELQPLEGIPMSLKDNIFTQGIETTCCSKMLKGYIPTYDATVWTLLKAQNAVLLGKTNMDEFAMGCTCKTSCFGAVKNPHDLNKVPGGSSGGSAAAVCADISVYSLGTDTGGSIRQPASFCGIVGLKPTYGALSRHGVIDFADSLDYVGPMAATVEDVAILYDNLAKKDPKDSTSVKSREMSACENLNKDIKGIKIGLPKQCFSALDKDVEKAITNAIKIYTDLGAEFIELDMPVISYALSIYYALATSEAALNFSKFDGVRMGNKAEKYVSEIDMISQNRAAGFGEEVKRRLLLGTYMLNSETGAKYLEKSQKIRAEIVKSFDEAFKKCEIMLTPTVSNTAPRHDYEPKDQMQSYISDICTVPANMAGIPAVSVPCGKDSAKMPIGMQLIADKFEEPLLLNVAHKFEVAAGLEILNDIDMGVNL